MYGICWQLDKQGTRTEHQLNPLLWASVREHYHIASIGIAESNMGDRILGSLRGTLCNSIRAKDLRSAAHVL